MCRARPSPALRSSKTKKEREMCLFYDVSFHFIWRRESTALWLLYPRVSQRSFCDWATTLSPKHADHAALLHALTDLIALFPLHLSNSLYTYFARALPASCSTPPTSNLSGPLVSSFFLFFRGALRTHGLRLFSSRTTPNANNSPPPPFPHRGTQTETHPRSTKQRNDRR